MANAFKNKVVYNGNTLIDISDTTAVASDVNAGKEIYLASGQKVPGTQVVYTISNNLTDASTSNNAVKTLGGSYYAKITPASGYAITSIIVTMGGVDITSQVWMGSEEQTIIIQNVTGNIVITAVAEESLEPITEFTAAWLTKGIVSNTIPRITIGATQADFVTAASEMPDVLSVISEVSNSYWSTGNVCRVRTRNSSWSYTNFDITTTRKTLTVNGVMYGVLSFTKESFLTAYQQAIDDINNNSKFYALTEAQLGNNSGRFVTTNGYWVVSEEVTENVIKRLQTPV